MADTAERVACSGDDVAGTIQAANNCVKLGVGSKFFGGDGTDVGGPSCEFVEGGG